MNQYYLTTPIYYVNAAPHIGHTYTTLVADTIKRLKALEGIEAYLVTGSDEHGQKIQRAAAKVGKSPREYTDLIAAEFEQTWQKLGLAIDKFQRTTSRVREEWLYLHGQLYRLLLGNERSVCG
jgi:methionyl-tRNA synthetase